MNTKYNASLRSTLALGALLLLTAVVTGCGVGLPTSPDVQSTEAGIHSNGRVAGAAYSRELDQPQEFADPDISSGSSGTGEAQPDGEIVVETPGHTPGNSSWGHSHKKIRN